MLTADTTVARSLRTDSNRRPAAYHAAALTTGATKAGLCSWPPRLRTWKVSRSKVGRVCRFPQRPSEPPAGFEPATLSVQASSAVQLRQGGGAEVPQHLRAGRSHPPMLCLWRARNARSLLAPSNRRPNRCGTSSVLGWTRTTTADALNVVPPAVGLRGHEGERAYRRPRYKPLRASGRMPTPPRFSSPFSPRASARIRTADPALTRGVLWPTELQRHGYQGWNRTSVLLIQSQGGMPATLLVSSACPPRDSNPD
jgi:hypothetical protein